jgi:hypothetical protein
MMNKIPLLEKFAAQSLVYVDTGLSDGKELIFSKEKFAELIVAECIEQIKSKGTDWVDFAPSQTGVRPEYWEMAQRIKQHFGVEE